jgi:endo-1,4-beta-xylanase
LIKGEWWLPPTQMTTDANGQVALSGFLGEYELAWGSEKKVISLSEKGETAISVSF